MTDSQPTKNEPTNPGLRKQLHEIIFEADTTLGALFDITLLLTIVASIVVVCLQTVPGIGILGTEGEVPEYASTLNILSWSFTILFTLEYLVRLYCVRKPMKYAFSFWGIIDLLAFLPDYLLLVSVWLISLTPFAGGAFAVIRALRLLRVFRIFKLGWFQQEADDLGNAIYRARAKIIVFLTVVMIVVTVMGTLMYEVEQFANDSQFESIPVGIYWAIVTMTTVGFGDVVPVTTVGKFLAAILILIGYSLIIVPTGFVSAEIIGQKTRQSVSTISCPSCVTEGHDKDAVFCKYCGDAMKD
ncbi:MAG: ion transporter [Planctomycetota bacterium]